MGVARDWAASFNHSSEGFAGIRWTNQWKRTKQRLGEWEPAEGEVLRIRRKGASGQDANTLVFHCTANPAAVPVGDKVVAWTVLDREGGVSAETTLSLSGYFLPLKSKLTVSGGAGSARGNAAGERLIEVNVGSPLPAIDYYPTQLSNDGGSTVRLRHWSFYANSATKALRHPVGWFAGLSRDQVLPSNGHIILGGLAGHPTWYDWTADYNAFGASLTEELWRLECEGLADALGNTDPRKLAVELEHQPRSVWQGSGGVFGYGDLLRDVWYGIARGVWGADRTLIVKPTDGGGFDSLISEFDFTRPIGHRLHLATHTSPGLPHHLGKAGGDALDFSTIGDSDFYARAFKQRMVDLGYRRGGVTQFSVHPHEWWDANLSLDEAEQGRRHGRMLTSLTAEGLYMVSAGSPDGTVDISGVHRIGSFNIEAYHPSFRPYCNRAGSTTT
jgi:hypothetical protein